MGSYGPCSGTVEGSIQSDKVFRVLGTRAGPVAQHHHHHKPGDQHELMARWRAEDTVPSGATVFETLRVENSGRVAASWRTQQHRGPPDEQQDCGASEPVATAQRAPAVSRPRAVVAMPWPPLTSSSHTEDPQAAVAPAAWLQL